MSSVTPAENWLGSFGTFSKPLGPTPLDRVLNAHGSVPLADRETADKGAMPSAIALRNAYEALANPIPTKGRRGSRP